MPKCNHCKKYVDLANFIAFACKGCAKSYCPQCRLGHACEELSKKLSEEKHVQANELLNGKSETKTLKEKL